MIDFRARSGEFALAFKQDATARQERFDEAHPAMSITDLVLRPDPRYRAGQTEEEA